MTLWHAFVATLILAVFVEIVLWIYYSPKLALVGALSVTVIGARLPAAVAHLGPLTVFPGDVLAAAMLSVALVRLLLRASGLKSVLPWLATLVLLVAAVIRGLGQFGLQKAGLQARGTVQLTACVLYFATSDPVTMSVVGRVWRATSGVIVVLAGLFWLQNGFVPSGGGGVHPRAIDAAEGLLIVQALVITAVQWHPARRRQMFVALALVVVVLSRQRTDWMVLIVSWVLICSASTALPSDLRRRARTLGTGALLLFTVLLMGGFSEFSTALTNATIEPTRAGSTLSWRLKGWRDLLRHQVGSSLSSIIVGSPSGKGFARQVDGARTSVAPHNFYLRTFLSIGVLGLGLVAWSFRRSLRLLRYSGKAGRSRLDSSGRVLAILLVGQLLFFMAYEPSMAQGAVLIGLALAFAIRAERSPCDAEVEVPV